MSDTMVVLLALFAGALMVFLALFHARQWRLATGPGPARALAVATLVFCLSVVSVLMAEARQGGPWTWRHAVLMIAVAVALTAVAYQWPAEWFRGLAVVFVLLGAMMVTGVGRHERAVEAALEQRAAIALLDEQLLKFKDVRSADDAQAAIVRACQAAGGEFQPPATAGRADPCGRLDDTTPADPAAIRLSIAEAELKIAGLRRAKTSDDALAAREAYAKAQKEADALGAAVDRQAAAELARVAKADADRADAAAKAATDADRAAELALARARNEQQNAAGSAVELSRQLTSGGQTAIRTAFAWSPEPWLWALLAAAAVFGYRRLEVLNGGLDPGPVAFDEKAPKDENHRAALRHHLLTNLVEPGGQPGTKAAASITDLVAIDPVRGPIAKALLSFANAVAIPQRGYEITASVVGPDDQSQVLVVIRSRRTQRTLKTFSVEAKKAEDALAEAAYEAAGWIIGNARAVPPWMQWVPNAGAAYYQWQRLKCETREDRRKRIGKMKSVVRATPGSAEMLVRYGYELDLGGLQKEALRQYERATHIWKDYGLAQYRLAIAYSSEGKHEASCGAFQRVQRGLWPPILVMRRLSIRERNDVARFRNRRRVRDAIDAAELVNMARRGCCVDPVPDRLMRSRWAEVRYNVACCLAVREAGDPEQAETYLKDAVKHLNDAMCCSDAYRLSGSWLAMDPDLERVRTSEVTKRDVQAIIDMLPGEVTTS